MGDASRAGAGVRRTSGSLTGWNARCTAKSCVNRQHLGQFESVEAANNARHNHTLRFHPVLWTTGTSRRARKDGTVKFQAKCRVCIAPTGTIGMFDTQEEAGLAYREHHRRFHVRVSLAAEAEQLKAMDAAGAAAA